MGLTGGTDATPHPLRNAAEVIDTQSVGSTDGTSAIPHLLHNAVEATLTPTAPSTPPTSPTLMTREQPCSGSCSPTVERLEVDGPWSAPSQEDCSVAAHLRRKPQAPALSPQADGAPTAHSTEATGAAVNTKPSNALSAPTGDPHSAGPSASR